MSLPEGHRGFSAALKAARAAGRAPLIGEIKCRSPKEGDLLAGRDPVALAATMQSAGAACISVVTESEHFGGSPELLAAVAAAVSVPVLRKDFITDARGVRRTRDLGASCMLLMLAVLDWPELVELHHEAHRLGLETLVEVHDETELRRALALDLDLLGINNRDIRALETDNGTVANTLRLLRLVPPEVSAISESAISTADEARSVLNAGALGVLIGTSILRAPDTASRVAYLSQALPDALDPIRNPRTISDAHH
ncbi:MAG: indole-3-glycerol-phosphate synthase [Rhodopirellula sp.]|nr:indole-3-glycerol-phosphate synthase [Rhodopirellula sp.]